MGVRMIRLFVTALAFVGMTSAAMADPVKLSDAQLDRVTAGAFNNLSLTIFAPVTVNVHNRGKVSGPTKVNVALSFPFTFINSSTSSSSFGIIEGGGGTFGILGPNIESSVLSRILSRTFTNISQR